MGLVLSACSGGNDDDIDMPSPVTPTNPNDNGYAKSLTITHSCATCSGNGKCATCNGTGKGCKTCGGTGKYCKSCGGSGLCYQCNGTKECEKCNGSGKVSCTYCNGWGKCPTCNGLGGFYSGGKFYKCSACNGNGNCKECKGKKTQDCIRCGGTGKCDECYGSGKCATCKGNPTCKACGGDGHCTTCKDSDGKCKDCNGTGYTTPTVLSFPSSGGNESININSNTEWTVSSSVTWVTLSPKSGKDKGTVSIKVDKNIDTASRTATIIVSYGNKQTSITVSQIGWSASASVKPTSLSFSSKGGSSNVTITSNTDWKASTTASWITLSPTSGNGDGVLTVKADANSYSYNRSATITINYGNNKATISVTQSSKASLPFEITNVVVRNVDYYNKVISKESSGIYSSQTQYLADEITFKVSKYGDYTLKRLWYNPGSKTVNFTTTYNLSFSYGTSNPVTMICNGWGSNTPGQWAAGEYTWEYYYEEELIYTKKFTIKK